MGISTRKESALLAKKGQILVDGVPLRDASKHIDPEKSEVIFCGRKINYSKYVYVMLNKPEGYVSATEDSKLPVVTELLSEELCGKAICSEPWEKVRFVTRKVGDVWYVFSCNIDADPVKDVTFTMPEDAPKNAKVEVLFENRSIALKDGVFSDSYPAHFRHVYKITR